MMTPHETLDALRDIHQQLQQVLTLLAILRERQGLHDRLDWQTVIGACAHDHAASEECKR
jgi:hypothetical protein